MAGASFIARLGAHSTQQIKQPSPRTAPTQLLLTARRPNFFVTTTTTTTCQRETFVLAVSMYSIQYRHHSCVCRPDSGDLTEPMHGTLGYAAPTPFSRHRPHGRTATCYRVLLLVRTYRGVRGYCCQLCSVAHEPSMRFDASVMCPAST